MRLPGFPQIKVIQALARRRSSRVFVVGGFLRDVQLGHTGRDVDFAVDKNALGLARAFAAKVKGAFVLLDKEHGSARVVKKEDGAVWTFDFTDFRGAAITADLARRDFTVNTFCAALSDGKDHSPARAFQDLKRKIIRMASAKAFSDDPLRLLRAFSLQAQTGFKIEAKTLTKIKAQAHLINRAAMERVREELFKVLHSPRAFDGLAALHKAGLLEKVLPQIAVMYGVKQGGYHHLDVWKHSLEVVRQFEQLAVGLQPHPKVWAYLNEEIGGAHTRLSLLKLGALLHDIGKPATRKKEKTRVTFHGHEHVGAGIARLAAKRLKLSVRERYFLEDIVRLHLRPGYLSNFKRPTAKAVFRYMRDAGGEAAGIAFLAMADQRATAGPLTTKAKARHHEQICRMLVEGFFKEQDSPKKTRLISGHDLIKVLKLKPSPLFAKVLGAVDEAQALGKITTREEALALAGTVSRGAAANK